jgi:death-on-curing protein
VRYLTLAEVLRLHQQAVAETGGAHGVRDLGALESAVAQPRAPFGGRDLYVDLLEKASALCFSLVSNHPFVDGNKRIGHAAMEVFLVLNGMEIDASVDEAERVILGVASGSVSRAELLKWVQRVAKKSRGGLTGA